MGIYIGDLLNQIRWDKKFKPEEFLIVYFDRIHQKTFEIPFISIGRSGNFFTVKSKVGESYIPLHRIKEVKRDGKVIWKRDETT